MEEKHEDKQVFFLFFLWICVDIAAPVDELKGHCAGYAEKEEINWTGIVMNRYICGHVEQQKRWRVDLNGYQKDCMKMNR